MKRESANNDDEEQVSPPSHSDDATLWRLSSHVYDPQYRRKAHQGFHTVAVHPKEARALQVAAEGHVQNVGCKSLGSCPNQEGSTADWRQLSPSLGIASPLSIKDFGPSLSESDQAEKALNELWYGVRDTAQLGLYVSTASFTLTPEVKPKLKITNDSEAPDPTQRNVSPDVAGLEDPIFPKPSCLHRENVPFIDEQREVSRLTFGHKPGNRALYHVSTYGVNTSDTLQKVFDSTDRCPPSSSFSQTTHGPIVRPKESHIIEPEAVTSSVFKPILISQRSFSPLKTKILKQQRHRLSPNDTHMRHKNTPVIDMDYEEFRMKELLQNRTADSPDFENPNPESSLAIHVDKHITQYPQIPLTTFPVSFSEYKSSPFESIFSEMEFSDLGAVESLYSGIHYCYNCSSEQESLKNSVEFVDSKSEIEIELQIDRSSSPESEMSQCSYSFLELWLYEPIQSQLRSQHCDYFLWYSGENTQSNVLVMPASAYSVEVHQPELTDSFPSLIEVPQNGLLQNSSTTWSDINSVTYTNAILDTPVENLDYTCEKEKRRYTTYESIKPGENKKSLIES